MLDTGGKNYMKYLLAACLFTTCANASAEELWFSCEGQGTAPDNIVWRYIFEIDKDTAKGIQRGVTYGGKSYSSEIEVVFTPALMQIRNPGDQEFTGYIDRRSLSFNFGGAFGSCKILPVEKAKF